MKIVLRNLKKNYGSLHALNGINLQFNSGGFYGLIGPNGAGKSTLVNIITNKLRSSSGSHQWLSDDNHVMSNLTVNSLLGMVFQTNKMDPLLTVKENLYFRGRMYRMSRQQIKNRIFTINKYLKIDNILNRRYKNLSGGQKRRCEIVRALLHDPKVLILDEPTTGLDPQTRHQLWQAINYLHVHHHLTVILVSHYLEEMASCDRITVLYQGRVKFNGSVSKFISANSPSYLQIFLKNNAAIPVIKDILNVFGSHYSFPNRHTLNIENLDCDGMIKVLYMLNKSMQCVDKFNVHHASLGHAYLHLLSRLGG